MSRLSAYPTSHQRSHSSVSVAASDTTYHSFYDTELFEPASPVAASRHSARSDEQYTPKPIVRHDSGYESAHSGSSYGRGPKTVRRSASQSRQQRRPVLKRASRSGSKTPFPRLSDNYPRMNTPKQHINSFYCFPSPGEITSPDETAKETEPEYHPLPPQTTHYWMSDHTRRLEYAAIDAASRGVKGWIIKHMPDCFVPKDNRRLTFDDDSGSVRRYRLELSDELSLKECKRADKKWKWSFKR